MDELYTSATTMYPPPLSTPAVDAVASSSSDPILLTSSSTTTPTMIQSNSQHFFPATVAAENEAETFSSMQQQQLPTIFSSSYDPYFAALSTNMNNNPFPYPLSIMPSSSTTTTVAVAEDSQSYEEQPSTSEIKPSRMPSIIRRPYALSAPSTFSRRVLIPYRKTVRPPPMALQGIRHAPAKIHAENRLISEEEEAETKKKKKKNILGLPNHVHALYRTSDKSKGLRHFSSKVCEKVKEKGRTNYNEVADELVAEYFDSFGTTPQSADKQQFDMKNIRRRIYDAINVLAAMNVIEKEKKEIRWVGLPTSPEEECKRYQEEKVVVQESIRKKTEQVQELVVQLVAFQSLIRRNRENEKNHGRPADSKLLFLPFMVINTSRETTVNCSIASDKTEFYFQFDQTFEVTEDIEILKRLGLSHGLADTKVIPEDRKEYIRKCLPPALQIYADEIMDGNLIPALQYHG